MAEVIQGVFPGGEGPDGALPGVSAVAALNLSPRPGDPEGNLLLAGREIAAALALEPSLRYVVLPELFTSAQAERQGRDKRGQKFDTAEHRDASAAALILQSYLDRMRKNG